MFDNIDIVKSRTRAKIAMLLIAIFGVVVIRSAFVATTIADLGDVLGFVKDVLLIVLTFYFVQRQAETTAKNGATP